MAAAPKVTPVPVEEKPESELATGNPTPKPDKVEDKKGLHDGPVRKEVVGEYPERPYSEAITPEHREVLKALGQEPQ